LGRRLILVAFALSLSCSTKNHREEAPLSADELYLVDAYVRVRTAGSFYPYQKPAADSLLTMLSGTVDTVRVARTIAELNATPERWAQIVETIENRITGRDSTSASESTGD
jgi:hypothetical protein